MDDKKKFFNGFDDDILDPEDFEEEDDGDTTEAEGGDDNTDNSKETKTSEATDEEETSDGDEEETEEEEEEDEEEAEEEEPSEADKNAEFARKRREREAREREAREAQIKKEAKLEAELGLIKTNPYTEKPIKDAADLEIYKLMKEIDDNGGDPVADLPSKIAELNRAKAEQEKAEKEKAEATSNKLRNETAELHNAYPDLNLSKLGEDQEFLDLCEKKEGRWTMLECYEYLLTKRKDTKEDKESDEAAAKGGKKVTRTPSANSTGRKSTSDDDYLEMTDEEFLRREHNSGDFF